MENKQPKYLALALHLREEISSGKLQAGSKIPSENELSTLFGISRQTVRQAVGLLEQEGLLERRHGSGTYVAEAQNTKHTASMTIGIVSTYMDSYIFPAIIRGMESVLTQNGYAMQLALTHNSKENEAQALKQMLAKELDGIIVEPAKSGLPNMNQPLYEEIQRRGIPLVFFNAAYPNLHFPLVALDDEQAGKAATTHLIEMGHRHIAALFQADNLQGHLRYAGYASALHKAGLALAPEHIVWYTTEDIPHFAEDFPRVRRALAGCTAAVCYNDQITHMLMQEAGKAGLHVPNDLSLVSIDDSDLAKISEVPFSSVAHPKEALGKAAAESILRLIATPAANTGKLFKPRLVKRNSVKLIHT